MQTFVIFLAIFSSALCARQARQISPFATSSQCSFGRAHELTECKWNLTNQEIIGRPSPFAWKLSSGKYTFFRGGPPLDGAGDNDGGYLLVETSQKTPSASDSVVVPSILVNATPADGRCIVFHYSMEGPTAERLRLAVQQPQVVREITNDTIVFAPRRETLWEQYGDTDGKWRTGAVLYSFGHPHHLVFEATVEDTSQPHRRLRGHIALDNIDLGTWKEEQEQLLLSSMPTGGQQEPAGASGFGAAGSGGGFGNAGSGGGFGGFGAGGGGLPPPPGVQGQDSLLTNPCMGHCNFESSFCSWKNDQDDDFDWLLGKGSLSVVTGPSRDHITFNSGLPSRGYAYIDSSFPRRPGDRARLVSPLMDPTEPDKPRCFRFWTHMYGNGIGTLTVLLLSGSSNTDFNARELWSLTGEAGNTWHQAQLSISSTSSYHVAFEATIGRNRLGDIAIDDVSFQQGSCPNTPQASAPPDRQGDCNFETDECGWTNSPAREGLDDIDWARLTGENSRMAPGRDHTSYNPKGYLMTPMRSTVQRPGDRAWLVSRLFNASQTNIDTRCLTFWYFMNEPIVDPAGPGLGALRVYVRKEDPNVLGSPASAFFSRYSVIWRLQNHQGGVWKFARAQIQQSINYRVIIEGLWGSGRNTGSIAIDDISFYDGTCSTAPQEARPHEMECFFDKDTCSWRNLYNGTIMRPDVDWRLASVSRRPANLPDHTFGAPSGYIYFDVFSQQGRVEIIRLVGPNITAGGIGRPRLCMTFWFAAFGAGETTQLKIYAVDTKSKDQKELWGLRVNQLESTRSDWNFAQVELETNDTDPGGQEVNIVFEGRASNGGFAIDDILIYEGICRSRPSSATPS